MVIKWEYCAVVEEEISHEEGGDDDIIKSPPVPASQSVNKYDADLNWIDNTGPHYWQGISVLQYKKLVNIPNTTLMRDIRLTKEGKLSRSMKARDVLQCCININRGSFAKFCDGRIDNEVTSECFLHPQFTNQTTFYPHSTSGICGFKNPRQCRWG